MAQISEELLRALESECATGVEWLLEERKQEDFEALQTFLSLDPSVNPANRRAAIYWLGRWGDPKPVAAIRKLLPHLDELERINAIDALGRMGSQEAFDGILEYAYDPSVDVRRFVVHGLGRINTPEARAKLKEIETTDPVDFVRERASKILKTR